MGMGQPSPIDDLKREHQTVLAEIKELEGRVQGLRRGAADTRGDARRELSDRLDMFRRSLMLHFKREEEGLFADAQRMVSERARKVEVLGQFFAGEEEDDMRAHAVLAARVEQMLRLLGAGGQAGGLDEQSLARLRAMVSTVRALLESHASKEDTMVFPMIQRALSAEQMETVRQRMVRLHLGGELTDSSAQGGEGLSRLDR